MSILDVSKVTRAMTSLIERGVAASPVWGTGTPTVLPLPPDQVDDDALSFYLYHIAEDPAFKNAPAPSGTNGNVRFTPMGLSFHYQLTAHHASETALSLSQSQLLMGCAVKVLHDYPIVDDDTFIGSQNILQLAGLDGTGSRLRVALQPIPQSDSVHYWTAGTKALRLSAYYEVRTVMLEPESPPTGAGRVLTRDVRVFTGGAPHLGSSSSVRSVTPPGATPLEFEVQPAQVTYGGRFRLEGSDLSGDQVNLLLRPPRGDTLVAETDAWGVLATPTRVSAIVARTAAGSDVLPGVHGVAVEVVKSVAGGGAPVRLRSNELAIVIEPEVTAVGAVTATGTVQVTGYAFAHAGTPALEVELFVGGRRFQRRTAGTLQRSEFRVVNATTISLRLPADMPAGPASLRILVNGAESPPRWVSVP